MDRDEGDMLVVDRLGKVEEILADALYEVAGVKQALLDAGSMQKRWQSNGGDLFDRTDLGLMLVALLGVILCFGWWLHDLGVFDEPDG